MMCHKPIITAVIFLAVHSIASPVPYPVPLPFFFWPEHIAQTDSDSNSPPPTGSNASELVVPFDRDTIGDYDFSYTYYGMPNHANHQHSDKVKNASLEETEISSTLLPEVVSKNSSTPVSTTTFESDVVPVPTSSNSREKRQVALVIGGGYPGYGYGYPYYRRPWGYGGYARPWGGGWRGGWRGGYGGGWRGRGGWGGRGGRGW